MRERRPILCSPISGCHGASREQSREHRGLRSRLVADAFGAPVLRNQGPIGRPGTARPMAARVADDLLAPERALQSRAFSFLHGAWPGAPLAPTAEELDGHTAIS
jgi:hypothetical protein